LLRKNLHELITSITIIIIIIIINIVIISISTGRFFNPQTDSTTFY